MFDESQHPRDDGGKFTDKGGSSRKNYTQSVNDRIRWAKENGVDLPLNTDGSVDDLKLQELYEKCKKETSTNKVVKVDMDADIQKQFDIATPQERAKIAYKYIMDKLRGKYPADDGRVVAIEKVGAKKMTHTLYEPKIRVIPELHELIKAGKLEEVKDVDHKVFKKFAYYNVAFKIGSENYRAVMNIGIRDNGDSTLYDINQFKKQ